MTSASATLPLRPLFIAHRGGTPENTLSALAQSLTRAAGIEFDVQLTRDGVPVIFHDADTERLTGEGGSIAERDLHEVRNLNVDGEPIPTLGDLGQVLEQHRAGVFVNLEIKPTPHAAQTLQACQPFLAPLLTRPGWEVVISSFDPRVLLAAQEFASGWPLAFLYEDLDALQALRFFGPQAPPVDLHPRHTLLTPDHLVEYGLAGRTFRTWTVDDAAEARRVLGLGVQHIITNQPASLEAAISET